MDWFSWLSNTGLEPVLVYEYSLAFTHNELEAEDIAYFNHEFLQSMGITIAKHRLEILKLARKQRKQQHLLSSYPPPVSRLVFAIKNTKRSLGRYLRALLHRGSDRDKAALVVVSGSQSRRGQGSRAMMLSSESGKNGGKLVVVRSHQQQQQQQQKGDKVMMLTDGSGSEYVVSTPRRLNGAGVTSPMVVDDDDGYDDDDDVYGYDDSQRWTPVVEEIKWDAMFQDLKPT